MDAASARVAVASATPANLRVYAIDGALLALFMISACSSVALIEHPDSPLRQQVASAFARRALVGAAMGLTALGLIYSPWGKRSGAFMNPALIVCFVRLGKLGPRDALGYIVAQFLGGTAGVAVCALLGGSWISHPAVNYVVTEPGAHGVLAAWFGELLIGFVMLTVVLMVNRTPSLAPRAGLFAAALVALFITFEAPLSGMSLNPARSFASALLAHSFRGFWIYLSAPVSGMLLAVELQCRFLARHSVPCGKLNHSETVACFVRCKCLDPNRSNQS
ncbi:MAG TPA: aquaporin [Polyangiaceae bacterium]|nr:aquaporin [Polyangiaceae bacterium]